MKVLHNRSKVLLVGLLVSIGMNSFYILCLSLLVFCEVELTYNPIIPGGGGGGVVIFARRFFDFTEILSLFLTFI